MRRFMLAVLALGAIPTLAAAQNAPYSRRVQFAAPPTPLDSNTIELHVRDGDTGRPVRAVVCLNSPRIANLVTDSTGAIRIHNLQRTNTHIRLLASGYHDTELIFFPGKLGRSYATVRLERSPTASRSPACDTNTRGPI